MEIKSTAMTIDLDWTFAWVHSDNSRRPDLAFCVWLLLAPKDILSLLLPLDIHFGIESLPLQSTFPVALLFQQLEPAAGAVQQRSSSLGRQAAQGPAAACSH